VNSKYDKIIRPKDIKKTYEILSCKKEIFEVESGHILYKPRIVKQILNKSLEWFEQTI
jgi:hypothetical protein